jgi:putative transposase
MNFTPKSKLPRLPREWYQGRAVVLWTHTFEDRATGWLAADFHGWFREVLLHTCARYALACPVYVLMPDHFHLVWMGLADRSDQYAATRFMRKHAKPRLGLAELQDRAHDAVLREDQRKRGAFVSACHYVCENPVRAGLVENWRAWPYLGAMVCGYPALDPRDDSFWDDFWKLYGLLVDASPHVPALPSRATEDSSASP